MGKKLTTNEFIERSKQIHGDTYDYTQTSYVSSSTKVSIVCKTHGVFEQWPSDHLRGSGCRLCNERQQMTTNQFIERAYQVHGYKFDYKESIYTNIYGKVTIICPIHGHFEQVAKDHLAGYGCPKCSGTGKKTTHDFIESARAVHGDKYDYSLVELRSMNKKVKIICRDHGEFMQRPADHVNGTGCPECSLYVRGRYSDRFFVDHPSEVNAPAVLYVVAVEDKFCKIGITKRGVSSRFANKRVTEVTVVEMGLHDAYVREQQLLERFKSSRYRAVGLTSRQFAGWTECFPLSMLEELKMAVEAIND